MFSQRNNLRKIVANCSAVGVLALLSLNEYEMRRLEKMALSAVKVANLLSTVFVMSSDYFLSLKAEECNRLCRRNILLRSLRECYLDTKPNRESLAPNSIDIDQYRCFTEKNKRRTDHALLLLEKCEMKLNVYDETFDQLHERNAKRLRNMCSRNGGVYIKLGQHLAMLDHVMPRPYQAILSELLANNPISSAESVRKIIQEDLGGSPEDLFSHFCYTPIASASLAQVHVATSRSGRKLAIKVQHEGLLEDSVGDCEIITAVVHFIPRIFKNFNYDWLCKEINKQLPLELNFMNEIGNLERSAYNMRKFIQDGDIAIPMADRSLSSKRILTMGFEEGFYISDTCKIKEMRLDEESISQTLSHAFCEQMFRYGFVHCDPHDGNILLRPHPRKGPGFAQLVLLDHGSYVDLADRVRRDYTRMWYGLVMGDPSYIAKHGARLLSTGSDIGSCSNQGHDTSVGSSFSSSSTETDDKILKLLASILTLRPYDDIIHANNNAMKSTKQQMITSDYAQENMKEIVELLGALPSDLLLLFKSNDCLRHVNNLLGVEPRKIAVAIAETSMFVVFEEDMNTAYRNVVDSIHAWVNDVSCATRLALLTVENSMNTCNQCSCGRSDAGDGSSVGCDNHGSTDIYSDVDSVSEAHAATFDLLVVQRVYEWTSRWTRWGRTISLRTGETSMTVAKSVLDVITALWAFGRLYSRILAAKLIGYS